MTAPQLPSATDPPNVERREARPLGESADRVDRRMDLAGLAPWLALAVVLIFGIGQNALRYHNHHLGLLGDDWDFLLRRESISPHTLLQPHNGHLSAVPVLLYRGIFAVFGISTAVPYIALLFLCLSACAVLSYVFVRRELGPWIALVVPVILLTLGAAAQLMLWPFMFTLLISLAFWLGAMLLIEKQEALTDVIACGLLILSVGSMSIGVALLPATALALVLSTDWRRALRRAWIVLLPLAVYLGWYAAYHPHFERSLAKVPGFIVNSFVATVSDLTGISSSTYTVPISAVLIAAICARCLYLRRIPSSSLYMAVGLLLVWVATGLSEGPSRYPAVSRFQFHNVLLLMLVLAPLVPRFRRTPRMGFRLVGGLVLSAVVVAAVIPNLGRYGPEEGWDAFRESMAKAELAAIQIARPAAAAPEKLFERSEETWEWEPFAPNAYYKAIDAHGSPVNIRSDLERATPQARHLADLVLVKVEGIDVSAQRDTTGTVRPVGRLLPLSPAGRGCGVVPAGGAVKGFSVMVPPGGLIIRPGPGPPVAVGLARFSDPPNTVGLNSAGVLGDEHAEVRIHPDDSSVPWYLTLTGSQAVTVCSVPSFSMG